MHRSSPLPPPGFSFPHRSVSPSAWTTRAAEALRRRRELSKRLEKVAPLRLQSLEGRGAPPPREPHANRAQRLARDPLVVERHHRSHRAQGEGEGAGKNRSAAKPRVELRHPGISPGYEECEREPEEGEGDGSDEELQRSHVLSRRRSPSREKPDERRRRKIGDVADEKDRRKHKVDEKRLQERAQRQARGEERFSTVELVVFDPERPEVGVVSLDAQDDLADFLGMRPSPVVVARPEPGKSKHPLLRIGSLEARPPPVGPPRAPKRS